MPVNKVRFTETVAKLRTMATKRAHQEAANDQDVFSENQQEKLKREESVITKAIEHYTQRKTLKKSNS